VIICRDALDSDARRGLYLYADLPTVVTSSDRDFVAYFQRLMSR
jgi:hypothetical protein